MSDELKNPFASDSPVAAKVEQDDASGPLDDFVAPQDVVGEDLASQLQALLDESKAAAVAPAAAPVPALFCDATPSLPDDTTLVVEPHDEEFETPQDVLGNEAESIDDTLAKAAAVAEEIKAIASLATGSKPALADTPPAASPVAATSVATAAPAPEAIEQLDEYLAGRAENEVAGEFETVTDVVEVEKAIAEAKRLATPPAPAVVAASFQPSVAPAMPVLPEVGDDEIVLSAIVPEPVPAPTATPAPVAAAPAPKPKRPRRSIVKLGAGALFRACTAINRPLSKRSPGTRNLIGYAGLITACNGVLLVVAKLLGLIH